MQRNSIFRSIAIYRRSNCYCTSSNRIRIRATIFRNINDRFSQSKYYSSYFNNHGATDELQIGHLARGNTFLILGGTAVHTAVCIKKIAYDNFPNSKNMEPTELSLPLTVEYKLKYHALGKIPLTNNRRERHGTEKEILNSRLIDRSVRPLFPKYYVNDIQITSTIHSIDSDHDPVVLAVNGASLALMKANVGWLGPIGCVRVGLINGEFILNPNAIDLEKSDLNLLYSATNDSIIMIEMLANEIIEETLNNAIRFAQLHVRALIQEQLNYISNFQLANNTTTTSLEKSNDAMVTNNYIFDVPHELIFRAESLGGFDIATEFFKLGESSRTKRSMLENQMRNRVLKLLVDNDLFKDKSKLLLDTLTDHVVQKAFRTAVLVNGCRSDGRNTNQIRQIECYPGIINGSLHGSALFKRGDTHVLCTVTLGARKDGVELEDDKYQHFFLHYDFPPYSTGSIGNSSIVNRRMIGHGSLAEKALIPLIPCFLDFPYTIRIHSECTSSSGSSSMASVCGASLALIDAGVPIKNIAAGLSIGLVMECDSKYTLLTDIIGTEDHFGDMDFKIAGTNKGVTAIQLDVKLVNGVPIHIIFDALDKAKTGRLEILKKMIQSLSETDSGNKIGKQQSKLKETAPASAVVKYDPTRTKLLYGPGGETKRYIEETYDCEIDVSDSQGIAYIYGKNKTKVNTARELVQDLLILVNEGDIVTAKVLSLQDYGAFVKITRAQEALLHIADITHDVNLLKKPVHELIAVGQTFNVKIIQVDKNSGLVKVSRKVLLKHDEPDTITPTILANYSSETDIINDDSESLQMNKLSFPTAPPRRWSAEYFRANVASGNEIENSFNNIRQPASVIPVASKK